MTEKDLQECVEVDFKITPGDSTINHALKADPSAMNGPTTEVTAPVRR